MMKQPFKRLKMDGSKIKLNPENPDMIPIVVTPDDELRILGKVVGCNKIE